MLARYAPHPCHRPSPLLHPLARWLDDQLAFNEILWTGYRNHPHGAIAAARKDGKVIRIRLAGERDTTASWPELDSSTPTAASDAYAGYATAADMGWRSAWSELAASGAIPAQRLPAGFAFSPLPARHFCAGHTFWVQQNGVAEGSHCYSVHTTFTEGGYFGKEWRFRDAAHWLLDPPDYYAGGRRFLSYTPPQPPADVPAERNASASRVKNDKYQAGWLVPDALRQSPRLQARS